MAKKNNYYVVWKGREKGIFCSWEDCKMQINGFADAQYMGFETEQEARFAFERPYWEAIQKKNLRIEKLDELQKPILDSLAVDAACSGNPGKVEYRGVDTKSGIQIFHAGPFEQGTNNIGEFLAIVHGLALLKKQGSSFPIYSDSVNAISWVEQKKCKTKLDETEKNKPLFDLVRRAEKWLRENSYDTKILKWNTKIWGEIPADFDRK